MTLKEKIANGLVIGGLLGILGGFGGISYSTIKAVKYGMPVVSEAVNRIYTIEYELESITGKAMYKSAQVRDHYLGLVGEYDTLMSKPLVVQEKKEYESAISVLDQNQEYFYSSLLTAVASLFVLGAGMTMKKKITFVL